MCLNRSQIDFSSICSRHLQFIMEIPQLLFNLTIISMIYVWKIQITLLHSSEGWNTSLLKKTWESWGFSTWSRLQRDIVVAFQYLKWGYKKDGERLLISVCSDRARGNSFKLKGHRFRLDIRKTFFMVGVVRHWNRFPREAVDGLSLEVFKVKLHVGLSKLLYWKISLQRWGVE